MKTLLLALALALTAGPLFGQTHVPNDADKINLLRAEAAKRKLNWEIACIPGENRTLDSYAGFAWMKGTKAYGDGGAIYYEDGVRNWWAVTDKTIGGAAYALYEKIQGPPNQIVEHKPKPEKKPTGCDYNIVLDNEHPTLRPCKEPK